MLVILSSCLLASYLLLFAGLSSAQITNPDFPNCTKVDTAFCEGASLEGTIIFRCYYAFGSAQPGNCQDNLDELYRSTYCWESSPTTGDAQCTADCVLVTAANGTTFYPVGCSNPNGTNPSSPPTTVTRAATTSSIPNGGSMQTTSMSPDTTASSASILSTTLSASSSSATATKTGAAVPLSWRTDSVGIALVGVFAVLL